MSKISVLIHTTHGTYGRADDAYGALLAANASVAKGVPTTMALVDDGVTMAKKGQDTSLIGAPSNLDELMDFLELGGKLIVVKESLESRGIARDELVDSAEVVSLKDLVALIEEHSYSLIF